MDCNELLRKVRLVINEAEGDNDVSLLSVDTRRLDDSILGLLPRAVSFIQKNKGATAGRVNSKSLVTSSLEIKSNGKGGAVLVLPDDFVSLVSFQLQGWLSPVNHLYAHNSQQAAWQHNEYTRAGCCRPVCVEMLRPDGKRSALLYPLPKDEGAKPLHFIYEATFNAADGLNGFDEGMPEAVVFACASLLYTMFERYDAANAMLSQALVACGAQVNKQ